MGNVFSCFETGPWDPHPEINTSYTPARTDVYQDMKQPLSHYFVSSGHNSYLTGNQLTSASGTATIIAVRPTALARPRFAAALPLSPDFSHYRFHSPASARFPGAVPARVVPRYRA